MIERDVRFRPTRVLTSARMSIEAAFGRLTQRLESSATLQPVVRRVVWIWVTTSMCAPSRASILTGLYAHHTGVTDNFGPHSYPAFRSQDESNDLAVWMHQAGYQTGLVGKYVNAYTDGFVHHAIPPGWDDWQ